MYWTHFKDLASHNCLAVTVVAQWFLTQEVAGSNNLFKIKYCLSLNSVKTFRENLNRHLLDMDEFSR